MYLTSHEGVPVDVLTRMAQAWEDIHGKEGVMAFDLAVPLNAFFVFTTKECHPLWRAEVDAAAKTAAASSENEDEARAMEWMAGTKTGMSSLTIMWFCGPTAKVRAEAEKKVRTPCVPYDTSDFGRCLGVMDALRMTDLDGMRHAGGPKWCNIADMFPELKAAYQRGDDGAVYALLKEAVRQ
jgi:hypothetical protein